MSLLTFQHLHGHGDRLGSTVLVDTNGLCHDHLAKAALSKGLAQGQPAGKAKVMSMGTTIPRLALLQLLYSTPT